jgi:hypothetical protein
MDPRLQCYTDELLYMRERAATGDRNIARRMGMQTG